MGKTLSDAYDSYVNWLVLFVFLTSVNLFLEAGAYLVSETTAEALRDWAVWPTRAGLISIAMAIITWIRIPRHKRLKKHRRAFFDGYVTETVKRSAFIAFFLTFCLVGILDVITNDTQLPADFFIKLPGFSMSAGFSTSFFIFNFSHREHSSTDR